MYQELQDLEAKSLEKSNCSGEGINMKKEEQEEDSCKTPTRSDQNNLNETELGFTDRSLQAFPQQGFDIIPHNKYQEELQDLETKSLEKSNCSGEGVNMKKEDYCKTPTRSDQIPQAITNICPPALRKPKRGPSRSLKVHFLLRLLLVSSFCLVGATRNFTIYSPDGDIIDCIDRLSQPSFSLPILKNHNFQETPTLFSTLKINIKDELNWQIWHRNGITCPEGTIPKRRCQGITCSESTVPKRSFVSYENKTTNSSISAPGGANGLHEYAIGMRNGSPKIYGTKVKMDVWHPKVERIDEFSLGQIWLGSGSYESEDLNTIEAGWQVCPILYSDYQPRFFLYWTSDAYHEKECYNLRCGGFIQTSRSILVEGAISPASNVGGSQIKMIIYIWKDPVSKVWWVGVGFDDTGIRPVGYWPVEIFTHLTDYAEYVQWGGEIINKNISGRHTITQMGSGYLPNTGKGAYMCDLEIATNATFFQPTDNFNLIMTNQYYYKIKKLNDTCFSYGGSEHAEAFSMRIDFVLPFLCFLMFLLF